MNRHEPKRFSLFCLPRWWIFIALPISLLFPLKAEAGLLEAVPLNMEAAASRPLPSVTIQQQEDAPLTEPSQQHTPIIDVTLPDIDIAMSNDPKPSESDALELKATDTTSTVEQQHSTSDPASSPLLLPSLDLAAAVSVSIQLPNVKVETPVIKAEVSGTEVVINTSRPQVKLPEARIKAPLLDKPQVTGEKPILDVKLPRIVSEIPAADNAVPSQFDDTPVADAFIPDDPIVEKPESDTVEPVTLRDSLLSEEGKDPIEDITQPEGLIQLKSGFDQRETRSFEQKWPEPARPVFPKPEVAILWPGASTTPNPPSSSGGKTQELGGSSIHMIVRFKNESLTLLTATKFNHSRIALLGSDQWSQPPPGNPPEYTFFS